MSNTSLRHQGNPLAIAATQLRVLQPGERFISFGNKLRQQNLPELQTVAPQILQVNVGKKCNMTCAHCHVDAGPDRREVMDRPTIDACLKVMEQEASFTTLDVTGGAPEMNPDFRYFVSTARELGRHVIDRCNLTILLANGYEDMARFLADHHVEIVASLPCYLEENTDAQRGDGVFRQSIEALQLLNSLGYGSGDANHTLTLVYNPVGPTLPPNQAELQTAYQEVLQAEHNVTFDRLFTITNMPISRYLEYLMRQGAYEEYMETLIDAFNPAAIDGLMCRNTISVGWDGKLYDCDFNQMLEMQLLDSAEIPLDIHRWAELQQVGRKIQIGQHCFGCTAGAGSGCQGAIA